MATDNDAEITELRETINNLRQREEETRRERQTLENQLRWLIIQQYHIPPTPE